MILYPKSYYKACQHLISFGAHSGDTKHGRALITKVLRDMQFHFGHERARRERRHLLSISGQFPVKK